MSKAEQTILVSRELRRFPLKYYARASGITQLNHREHAACHRFAANLVNVFGQFQEAGISPSQYRCYIRRLRRRFDALLRRDDTVTSAALQDKLLRATELADCYIAYSALKADSVLFDMGDLTMELLRKLAYNSTHNFVVCIFDLRWCYN
jgi:hypothetical protein